jgi:hypothetical protein
MSQITPTEIYGSLNVLQGLNVPLYGDGSVYAQGNLQADGTLSMLNTTDTNIKDGIVGVNIDSAGDCAAGSDGGLWINRNSSDVITDTPKLAGLAQGGSASSITLDAGSSLANDFYSGWTVHITAGTGNGQTRIISTYVGASKIANVSVDWVTAPDATSTYELFNTTRAAMFYDTSNKEFALSYTSDPYSSNPLDVEDYAQLHVGSLVVDGDISGAYEIVIIPENSSTPVTITQSAQRGSFFIIAESIDVNGACANFAASARSITSGGSITRLTSSPASFPSNVELNVIWTAGNKIQLYHSVTGPSGALLSYKVLTKNVTFSGGSSSATASNVGLFGVGFFVAKVGNDLHFKNLAPASSKLTIVDNVPNSDVDIDIVENQININNLGGGPLNVVGGGTGAITFTAGQILQGNGILPISASGILASDVVTLNGVQALTNKTITDVTNTVTASSLFASGSSVSVNINGGLPPVIGNVLRMTTLTDAEWTSVNGLTVIPLINFTSIPIGTAYTAVANTIWNNALYSGFTTGTISFYANIPGIISLEVQFYNFSTSGSLGSLVAGVSGFYSFPISLPLSDAQLQLRIRASALGVPRPQLFSATLTLS